MTTFGSQLQTHWDWRAACNFMAGGTGGALLAVAVILSAPASPPRVLVLLALALVGFGLLMVWLEIGRPWRFLHVFFHPQTSWMTREGTVGTVLFPLVLIGTVLEEPAVLGAAGVTGVIFLYCQARILKAAKGVPAWREPALTPLVMSTGFVEGASVAMMFFSTEAHAPAMWVTSSFILLIAVRAWHWYAYRDALTRGRAPDGTLHAVAGMHREFMITGVVLPALVVVVPVVAAHIQWSILLAGALALVSGWRLKYALITKAAYKQGYGIGKLRKGRPGVAPPVRRRGDPVQL